VTLPGLFGVDAPEGFRYRADIVDAPEEASLLAVIAALPFTAFVMHGTAARRRMVMFGAAEEDAPAPVPEWLQPLRARIAAWTGAPADAYSMALVLEYPPGAPIGWHRDAPQYGIVAGLSLLSSCRMKLRPYVSPRDLANGASRPPRKTTHEITLEPRSGYVMTGKARNEYEHSIPAVEALRYSVTFRTLRGQS
jgi:alkylated DNA repair dioxygenase AlkB